MRARNRLHRLVATCALGVVLAGCSTDAVAPAQSGTSRVSLATATLVNSTVFTYDPSVGQSYSLAGGAHRITFPSGAVCDPALSTYGPTEWDKPCAPLVAPIAITATTYTDELGHPYIDFQPALRFVPGAEVVLYMKDKAASENPTAVIKWCGPDGACVDESAQSPAVVTRRDDKSGTVFRVIKHFSGYLISAS